MKKMIKRIILRLWLSLTGLKFCKREINPSSQPVRIIKAALGGNGSLDFRVYRRDFENVVFWLNKIKHRNYKAYIIRCDFSSLGNHDLKKYSDLSFVILSRHNSLFEEDMLIEILMGKYLQYLEHTLLCEKN